MSVAISMISLLRNTKVKEQATDRIPMSVHVRTWLRVPWVACHIHVSICFVVYFSDFFILLTNLEKKNDITKQC